MEDRGKPFGHFSIPAIRFTRDSAEHVPGSVNAELIQLFQKLQVYEGGVPLPDETKHVVVETFDPWLNAAHPRIG